MTVRVLSFLVLVSALFVSTSQAQDVRTLVVTDSSSVEVDGSSNKSEWTVDAEEVSGSFEVAGSGEDLVVSAAQLLVVSRSVVGGYDLIMDRLIHKALDVRKAPSIEFVMTEITSQEVVEGGVAVTAHGTLEMAGETQEIDLEVLLSEEDGGLRMVGSHPIDMTEWGMKPPTALFGALHVARDVVVRFDVLAMQEEPAGSGE